MPEEPTPVVAPPTEEGQPPATNQPPAESPTSTPETPTWQAELDKAEAKDILAHPKLRGIIGSEAQRLWEARTKREQEQASRQTREQTEGEMLKMFEDNADYVKEHYPKAYERFTEIQQERAMRELGSVKETTRSELAQAIGRALADVPEWKELTDTDHETLAKAVIGKSDDEVIPIFNRTVLDIVAKRRAEKLLAEWREKELPKERETIRQEEAAKLLKKTPAPVSNRGKANGSGTLDIKGMTDQEFNDYWNRIRSG